MITRRTFDEFEASVLVAFRANVRAQRIPRDQAYGAIVDLCERLDRLRALECEPDAFAIVFDPEQP